jgi:DNA-binding transcriptional LysR family regulator
LFAELVLPEAFALLERERPGVRIEVRLGHGYEELFAGGIDVALRRGPLADSTSLLARKLGPLSQVVVLSPKLAQTASLAELPWIQVGPRLEPMAVPGERSLVSPRLAVDSQRVALALAQKGLGVARLNLFLVRDALARGELVELLTTRRSVEDAYLVTPRRTRPSALVRDFITAVVAAGKAADIWG